MHLQKILVEHREDDRNDHEKRISSQYMNDLRHSVSTHDHSINLGTQYYYGWFENGEEIWKVGDLRSTESACYTCHFSIMMLQKKKNLLKRDFYQWHIRRGHDCMKGDFKIQQLLQMESQFSTASLWLMNIFSTTVR